MVGFSWVFVPCSIFRRRLTKKIQISPFGQVLELQPSTVAVSLCDSGGKLLPGERGDLVYTYRALEVSMVSPSSTHTSGGGVVTVRGRGFSGGGCRVRCRFGSRVQVAAEIRSEGEVTCKIPPLPTEELELGDPSSVTTLVRTVDVSVTANGIDFAAASPQASLSYTRRVLCVYHSDLSRGVPNTAAGGAGGRLVGDTVGGGGIAIFGVPKSFVGEAGDRQKAAIRSWARIVPPSHVKT